MGEPTLLDKTYNVIITRMVKTGQAPHYSEIAAALKISMEDGRKALSDLIAAGVPGCWQFPNTDYVASFAPFSNLPTQYRITIDGEQKWFGQWGFESLAVCWLFPGKTVRIDAPCLDCGKPIRVEMRDGEVLKAEPKDIMGYVAVPFAKWMDHLPHAWSTMNLFRSEEHIRNWASFDPETEEGIVPLANVVQLFSGTLFQRRLDVDFFSRHKEYWNKVLGAVEEMGKTKPFWWLPR